MGGNQGEYRNVHEAGETGMLREPLMPYKPIFEGEVPR